MDSHSKRYPNLAILNCSLLRVLSSSIRRFSPSPLWFCYTVDHRFPSQGFCYERGGNILMYNCL
ncbi:hypothetical protein ES332_A07G053100v1 [Gossypium tomentosum]|uniref:Uncharacterized protein n=1 Tax=Gossypium tomentosum TaxID=34277 RepID=A0A5D2PPE9_GOSTO|nr:hypothetical protein ES332_A07G053100v1 [Gossypium tomentosum]